MRRHLVALLVCVGMFGTGASAAAQTPADPPQEEAKSAEDSVDGILKRYDAHLFAKRFQEALAVADELRPDQDNPSGQAFIAAMRAAALLGLKRDKEAAQLIATAERIAPQSPDPSRVLLFGGLIAERYDVAADALDRMIARFPDVVRDLDRHVVGSLLRNAPEDQKARNDDRTVNLARIGYGGDGTGDYLAQDAVGILLRRGEVNAAADLLRYIDQPTLVEDMLIQRRYGPLWEQIAASAGPRLETVRASSVRRAERAVQQKPDDAEARHLLANALRHAGRHDEVIAMRERLPDTKDEMGTASEEVGWLFNNIALSMHEKGRAAEADRLFAQLNDAPMPPERGGWRVSMVINRLELLVIDGKFDLALPLLDTTEAFARDHGSPYARQLVRRLRLCTFVGLGRKAEASAIRADLLAHAKDAWHATVDAMLCADDLETAEKVALDALRSDDAEEFGGQLVRSLQPVPLSSDDPSVWQERWAVLRQRPAIAMEYERLGRDLPEALRPPPIIKAKT